MSPEPFCCGFTQICHSFTLCVIIITFRPSFNQIETPSGILKNTLSLSFAENLNCLLAFKNSSFAALHSALSHGALFDLPGGFCLPTVTVLPKTEKHVS